MSRSQFSRRQFVQTSAAAAAAAMVPYWMPGKSLADDAKKNPLIFGCIGSNPAGRWSQIVPQILPLGNVVAVCDVDSRHADGANARVGGKADTYGDYRKLLDRKDIEAVTITTPDHWHTKIAIAAMKAGKDVYCEKPLTLTVDEGQDICYVAKKTGRVFQVGTQQRSEFAGRFLQAVAMVHAGRIGKLQKITAAIGTGPALGPFAKMPVPPELNWDVWLGQAPVADYTEHRCHGDFRWWYEYSGGKMTDWGAHHVDIATWAMNMGDSGPTTVEGTATFPNIPNGFNTAVTFQVHCKYDNGVDLLIRDDTENGITFEGDQGTFFVNRGTIRGKPVDALKDDPLPKDALLKLHKGKPLGDHMANFVECVRTREQPISDVFTHHRALSTCHLANIAIRLNRKLTIDPSIEQIIGDDEANAWLARDQREPYQI